jgi:O-antigen/teichoic acid export membrane protein
MPAKSKALNAGAWAMTGYAGSQIVRLVSNILLARLLFEEAFALMAIVGAIIQGLTMFSDVGLGPNVVQNRRGDARVFLDTVWTIQIVRGLLLALFASALAWPVASFYATTDAMAGELKGLLPLAAVATLISGFNSTRLLTAARHLNLGRITVIDFVAQVSGILVVIVIAAATKSLYALPIGAIVSATVTCVSSHTLLPGPSDRLRWDPAVFREVLSFGQWLFVSTITSFLALQIDRLALPKLFPLDQVGVYAIAVNIGLLVPTLVARLQMSIAFPIYANICRDDPGSLPGQFTRVKRPMLITIAFLTTSLATVAGPFVDLAYDERYASAGLFIALISVASLFACIEQIYGSAYLALGRSKLVAASNAAKVAAYALALVPMASYFGIIGACLTVVLAEIVKAIVATSLAGRIGRVELSTDLTWAAVGVAASAFGFWLFSLSSWLESLGAATRMALGSLAVAALFSPWLVKGALDLRALQKSPKQA